MISNNGTSVFCLSVCPQSASAPLQYDTQLATRDIKHFLMQYKYNYFIYKLKFIWNRLRKSQIHKNVDREISVINLDFLKIRISPVIQTPEKFISNDQLSIKLSTVN